MSATTHSTQVGMPPPGVSVMPALSQVPMGKTECGAWWKERRQKVSVCVCCFHRAVFSLPLTSPAQTLTAPPPTHNPTLTITTM